MSTIAEQLQLIAENEQKVYNAGYANGLADGESNNNGILEYATNVNYLFNGATFPDNYELTLNLPNIQEEANRVIRYAKGIRKITLIGNPDNKAISFQYAFNGGNETSLEIINATQWGAGGIKGTYINTCFSNPTLHTILGEIDFSAVVNISNAFANAINLQNVRFKAATLTKSISLVNSSLLSTDSINSIIGGLADLTGTDTQTLTLHSTIVLTEEQTAAITAKNWTLVQ